MILSPPGGIATIGRCERLVPWDTTRGKAKKAQGQTEGREKPTEVAGDISVSLRAEAGLVTLAVRDTGVGFPAGIDIQHTESLGLRLVGMLTEQLGGTLTLTCESGTLFIVTFPYPRNGCWRTRMLRARMLIEGEGTIGTRLIHGGVRYRGIKGQQLMERVGPMAHHVIPLPGGDF
jgi:hypothetical protein